MSAWLQEWLQELNLMEYYSPLLERGLTSPSSFVHLDKDQLKEHGITKPGHLNRLHKAVLKLSTDNVNIGQNFPTNPIPTGENVTQPRSNPSSPPPSNSLHTNETGTRATLSSPTKGAPPVPMRRSTKRRSLGQTMSCVDGVTSPYSSKESTPSRELSPQPNEPVRHSVSAGNLVLNAPISTDSGVRGSNSSSVGSSPTRSSRVYYENVGPTATEKLPPKPLPRISSVKSSDDTSSLESSDVTLPLPPLVPDPPQTSLTSDLPSLPKVSSYQEILQGEVWSQMNPPQQDTPTINDYEEISAALDSLPPPISTISYDEVRSPSLSPPPVPPSTGEYVYDSLTPLDKVTSGATPTNTNAPPTNSVTLENQPPPVLPRRGSLPPSFVPPTPPQEMSPPLPDLPPKEKSPPPLTSVPNFTPLPPPMDLPVSADYEEIKELKPTPPNPVQVDGIVSITPSPSKPSVPMRKSSLPVEPSQEVTKVRPPVPNRKSSLIHSIDEADTPPKFTPSPPPSIKLSPPPPQSPPPFQPSPPPSLSPPPPPFKPAPPPPSDLETEQNPMTAPPPVIPKRISSTLPPPPPPPITYEDHPEGLMEDPETYLTSSNNQLEYEDVRSVGSSASPVSLTPSTGSSPLPVGSRVVITQLSSGSDSFIGLTPPTERGNIIESDYAMLTDSDSEGNSPFSTPNVSTLRSSPKGPTLEPLKEDTLLASKEHSVSPPPPTGAKPRPKSTFVEQKQQNLLAAVDKQSTTPREGLSMSYDSVLDQKPPMREKSQPKRIHTSQSVRSLAKDLEKQTLRHSAMPRSLTETNVHEGQLTISPNKYRNSTILEDIDLPQTVESFLHKKGGKRNERPYQKRWVVFDGEVLKYFRQKGEKEIDARNNVKLSEMIDVKRVADPDQTNRFDLVVINRVFQFFADTEDTAQLWVNVLHAAITKFNPSDGDDLRKEGGNMNNPDKQGFLMKQGHGRFAASGFKQRYVALKDSRFAYYDSKEDFVNGKPIHILDMRLANVRPDMTGKTNRLIITMPNQRSYVFQASTGMERSEWIEKLQEAILNALNLAPEKKEGKKGVKAADILARIQENPSNKMCADCSSDDPSWAIVNRGIMVCIECSGVHRSMGVHISKVRSVELDVEIWTETLIQLFQSIGNSNSNLFWEKYCQSEKLDSSAPREIREMFIRAKYESKSWIPRNLGDTPEVLSKALCVSVASDDLMRTTELLVTGADPCFIHPDIEDSEKNTPMKIAKACNKLLQVELLEQNGALLDNSYSEESQVSDARHRGHLSKTGSDRKGWKDRYCMIDGYRGLEYFKTETDAEILGAIKVDSMLGVSQCDVEGAGKDRHCFEVITPGRAYLFAADSSEDMNKWLTTIKEIIPKDNADKLGYDKVGFLSKRSPQNVGWKKRWFSLKEKKLTYFKKEEVASIDMKSVTNIKPPEQGSFDSMCSFQVVTPDRVYYLKADNPTEAESWVQALKQTQVSVPLSEHPLTSGSSGTGIPVVIHKCLQFVDGQGLELEGIYRISGEKPKIRNLIQLFNLDPRAVVLDDSNYCVHDVTGALKKFLKSLPDPLLTHQLYRAFLDAAVMSDHETKLHQLQSLIDQLPPVNKETLKRIISHLLKVVHHESSNKMSKSNLTSLFGPTLMTVDGDPPNFSDMQSQYACIEHMMSYYEWLFNATGEEEKKEEAMQEALKKLEAAKEQHKQQGHVAGMNTSTSFIISVHINEKNGDVCGMKVTMTTTAAEVVEFVTTTKNLPPTNYCVYLVLGEAECERALHSLEHVLGVQTSDSYLCLKKNILADKIKDYDSYSGQCVMMHVMEKKKWKKYPCAVKNKNFIIYKDSKCQVELNKIPLFDADVFVGIERKNIDVKNPLPTKYPLSLLVRVKDNNKFLCADSAEDRLLIAAAVIFAKFPDGIQTPVMPVKTVPKSFDARNRGISVLTPPTQGSATIGHASSSSYLNYKGSSNRSFLPKKNTADDRLMKELTLRQKSTSPERF